MNIYTHRETVSRGIFQAHAPAGYEHILLPSGEKTIALSSKSPMIKEAFELYALGNISINALTLYLQNKYRIPLGRSALNRILKNPFYYGYMVYEQELYRHSFGTIVTEELFYKVQTIINTKRAKKDGESYKKHRHLYQKLFKCGECETFLFGDRKKNKYTYYKCSQYKKKHEFKAMREELFNEKILPFVKKCRLDKNIFNNPDQMYLMCKLLFSKMEVRNQIINLELIPEVNFAIVGSSINAQTSLNDLPHAYKQRIKKVIKNYTDPILKACMEEKHIDTLAQLLGKDIIQLQADLFDLQLEGKIEETESGKWKTIK